MQKSDVSDDVKQSKQDLSRDLVSSISKASDDIVLYKKFSGGTSISNFLVDGTVESILKKVSAVEKKPEDYCSFFSDSGEYAGSIKDANVQKDLKSSLDDINDIADKVNKIEILKKIKTLVSHVNDFQKKLVTQKLSLTQNFAKSVGYLRIINEYSGDEQFDQAKVIVDYLSEILKNASNPNNQWKQNDGIGAYITDASGENNNVEVYLNLHNSVERYEAGFSPLQSLKRSIGSFFEKNLSPLVKSSVTEFIGSASKDLYELGKEMHGGQNDSKRDIIKHSRELLLSEIEVILNIAMQKAIDDGITIKNIHDKKSLEILLVKVNLEINDRGYNSKYGNFFHNFFIEIGKSTKYKTLLQTIYFNANRFGSKEASKKHDSFCVIMNSFKANTSGLVEFAKKTISEDFSQIDKLNKEASECIEETIESIKSMMNQSIEERSEVSMSRIVDIGKAKAESIQKQIEVIQDKKANEISSEFTKTIKNLFSPIKNAKDSIVTLDKDSQTSKHGFGPKFIKEFCKMYEISRDDYIRCGVEEPANQYTRREIKAAFDMNLGSGFTTEERLEEIRKKYAELVKDKRRSSVIMLKSKEEEIFPNFDDEEFVRKNEVDSNRKKLALTSSFEMAAIESKEHKIIEQFQASDSFLKMKDIISNGLRTMGLYGEYEFKVGLSFVDFDSNDINEKYRFDFFLVGKDRKTFSLSSENDLIGLQEHAMKKIKYSMSGGKKGGNWIDECFKALSRVIEKTEERSKKEKEDIQNYNIDMKKAEQNQNKGPYNIHIGGESSQKNEGEHTKREKDKKSKNSSELPHAPPM